VIDVSRLTNAQKATSALIPFAAELIKGGVTLLQYRNKRDSAEEILSQARELRRISAQGVRLIMNDRADLCLAASFDGVHLGQEDLSVEAARAVVGGQRWVGISTHNGKQVAAADATSADYIAIGPVFPTRSKGSVDPVVGLAGVSEARKLTRKPLVAIGGITRGNCVDVIAAGADSIAVISNLLEEPRKAADEFLRLLL
jgi:thiamine-phosphate pyrophosphorylase